MSCDQQVVGTDGRAGLLQLTSDLGVGVIGPGVEGEGTSSEAKRSSTLSVNALEPSLRAPKRSSAATTMLVQTVP